MRTIIIIFSLGISFSTLAQIGPPSLSIGADKVLFEQGVIDVELLGAIIQEKQSEVKQEFARRFILNETLQSGPYTTYSYADELLKSILDHKNKSVIKKQILEKSAELAIVLGIGEAYLRLNISTDTLKQHYLQSIGKLYSNTSDTTKKRTTPFSGKFFPKVSWLYKLKELGSFAHKDSKDKNNNFTTNLSFIYLDLVNEVCRNNESLQEIGFFHTQFDDYEFRKRSHYRKFLALNKDESIKKILKTLYKNLDGIITTNFKYASTILNQQKEFTLDPIKTDRENINESLLTIYNQLSSMKLDSRLLKKEQTNAMKQIKEFALLGIRNGAPNISIDQIKAKYDEVSLQLFELEQSTSQFNNVINEFEVLQASINSLQKNSDSLGFIESKATAVYNTLISIDLDSLKLTQNDLKTVAKLSELAYFGMRNVRLKNGRDDYDNWVLSIQSIIPDLLTLNLKTRNEFSSIISDLELLSSAILNSQLDGFQKEMRNLIGEEINVIDDKLASLFQILTNLDKAESYDQITKLIVDCGNIYLNSSTAEILNNLTNIQAYLSVNTDLNRVDIQVEDLIYFLADKYIDNSSAPLSFYLTLGFNYSFISGDKDNLSSDFSFAAEKVGLKLRLHDFEKEVLKNKGKNAYNIKPLVSQFYVIGYASGLLYQIEELQSEKGINGTNFGTALGIRFFNGLDLAIGISRVKLNDTTTFVIGPSLDIPITEYLSRIGDNRKKGTEGD
ncbi:MAG: hypothetical protein NXI20_10255 [bacterium]|nr:hypothetical protein [bacterium]